MRDQIVPRQKSDKLACDSFFQGEDFKGHCRGWELKKWLTSTWECGQQGSQGRGIAREIFEKVRLCFDSHTWCNWPLYNHNLEEPNLDHELTGSFLKCKERPAKGVSPKRNLTKISIQFQDQLEALHWSHVQQLKYVFVAVWWSLTLIYFLNATKLEQRLVSWRWKGDAQIVVGHFFQALFWHQL